MIRTSTKGIFQSDILIRSAIIAGLQELRDNPWLLDFAFAWLADDELTRDHKHYGQDGLREAKNWLLKNEIFVQMAYTPTKPELPAIGIELVDSSEAGATFGDTHHETAEDILTNEIVSNPAPVIKPFTPKSYKSKTGIVTLPNKITTTNIFPGMVFFDTVANRGYVIEDVIDDSTFKIPAGTVANFSKAYVTSRESLFVLPIHSLLFRETYRVTCYVGTAPAHLMFLHTALLFMLLRSKEELLEGRGFENTSINVGGISRLEGEDGNHIHNRSITISGQVRQFWPGKPSRKLDGIVVESVKIIGGKTPDAILPDTKGQGWEMEEDGLSPLSR
jgi:hypothetical protein